MKATRYLPLLFLIFCIQSGLLHAEEKIRMAVMDFSEDGVSARTGKRVSEIISTDLVSSKRFILIERSQISQILNEQGLQSSGCTETSCSVKIGKMISADKILVGTVMKIGNRFIITGRIVDVEKGFAIASAEESAINEDLLYEAAKSFSRKIAQTGNTKEKTRKSQPSPVDKNAVMEHPVRDVNLNPSGYFGNVVFFSFDAYKSPRREVFPGFHILTVTLGGRYFMIGSELCGYTDENLMTLPVIMSIPLFFYPHDFTIKNDKLSAEIRGIYLENEIGWLNMSNISLKRRFFDKLSLRFDLGMLAELSAGVMYSRGNWNGFAAATLKIGYAWYERDTAEKL